MSLSHSSLELLQIFFRHGHRTPGFPAYPQNLHKKHMFLPYGRGQLTNDGKRTTYQLGQYIRNYYKEFIHEDYFPGIIKATCATYDRCKVSLQLFLAGLFRPKGSLVWNPHLLWQPIPFSCTLKSSEHFFNSSDFCKDYIPAYKQLHDDFNLANKYKNMYKHIEQYSGRKINTAFDIYEIYIDLATEAEFGLNIPEWAAAIYPEPITKVATLHYKIACGNQLLRRCTIKNPFDEIISEMMRSTRRRRKPKLHAYSCHEFNLAHFLIGLASFEKPHIPAYCSCLVLEVHHFQNEYFVQGKYKPNVLSDLQPINMWGGNPCRLSEFIQKIKLNFE